ncbi:MAG: M20/M25/M40 family metallo-hydrolase, partial [Chitinophagaceae bacterium]
DKIIIQNLKAHVSFLADDKLEGRRAGSAGEKLASEYLVNQFKSAGISPGGINGTYLQPFDISDGKQILKTSIFNVNQHELVAGTDYFPLAYSPNCSGFESMVSPALSETGQPWFKDIGDILLNNKENPHFDLEARLRTEIKNAADKGAKALIFFNTSNLPDQIKFDVKDKTETAQIPVIYLTAKAREMYMNDISGAYDIKIKIDIGPKIRQANNVVALINNNADKTIILGAHFDHLGYGEDGNSMMRTGEKMIHNGADDNASGTAALIELAKLLKKSKAPQNNYLFVAFSGEELGLYGSKYFVENPTVSLEKVNYMINMDMVGRLNDSSKTITVGGFGTSPAWNEILYGVKKPGFNIKVDSSGTGPSDHTSFYRKNIPVLFFFTGLHSDYHRPTDDAGKINYTGELLILNYINNLVIKSQDLGKLSFLKTREQQTSSSARFSVSMGIMPDYTFAGAGVKVDGVSDGRPALKAGIKTGDIVTQLGEYKISSVESYMQALGKFKKGDAIKVIVKRGTEEKIFDIVF